MLYADRDFYDLGDTVFSKVSKAWAENRVLSPIEFFMIVRWKSNRSITKVRKGFNNTVIESFTKAIDRAITNEDTLTEVYREYCGKGDVGIRVRIFSAFLSVRREDYYPICDERIIGMIKGRINGNPRVDDIEWYFRVYAPRVREVAKEEYLSLREFDKKYWGRSLKTQIETLITDMT